MFPLPHSPNQQVKLQHLNQIRTLLRKHTTATKTQLAQWSGLSVVTLGSLIGHLSRTGEVFPDALLPSDCGRPAQVYRFNADLSHALAICVYQQENGSGYGLLLSITDLQGRAVWRSSAPTADVNTLLAQAAAACERDPLIASIAVGIPGIPLGDRVLSCDETALEGVALKGLLAERTQRPVVIVNDMNAAVYGYAQRTPPGAGCTVGVYFPNGICPGAGILLDGKLVPGSGGRAGELGSLPLGIDWASPPKLFEQAVSDCLQTIAAVIAPHRVVIYREGLDVQAVKACMNDRWPAALARPALSHLETLIPDYALGVERLALAQLWPADSGALSPDTRKDQES